MVKKLVENKTFSLLVPKALYEKLRRYAFLNRKSIAESCRSILSDFLGKGAKK